MKYTVDMENVGLKEDNVLDRTKWDREIQKPEKEEKENEKKKEKTKKKTNEKMKEKKKEKTKKHNEKRKRINKAPGRLAVSLSWHVRSSLGSSEGALLARLLRRLPEVYFINRCSSPRCASLWLGRTGSGVRRRRTAARRSNAGVMRLVQVRYGIPEDKDGLLPCGEYMEFACRIYMHSETQEEVNTYFLFCKHLRVLSCLT